MTHARTRALDVLTQAGVDHRIHAYRPPERHGLERGRRPAYGLDAAAALGVDPARVLKTIVVDIDGRPFLAVLAVDRELDLKRFAAVAGGRTASLTGSASAERLTGQVVGGISPLGTRRPLPVIVDDAVTRHSTVHVSAGRRGLQVELDSADLVRLCSARSALISRDERPG